MLVICRRCAPSPVTCAEAPGGVDLRHALLDGTVGDDIDDISDLVLLEVGREGDVTLERC